MFSSEGVSSGGSIDEDLNFKIQGFGLCVAAAATRANANVKGLAPITLQYYTFYYIAHVTMLYFPHSSIQFQ
jgi:hypothetical protein